MGRPCGHTEIKEGCGICSTYLRSEKYRKWWDHGIRPEKKRKPERKKCIHLGEETGVTIPCVSCEGRVRIKSFYCKIKGECTTHKRLPILECCMSCDAYEVAT